MDKMIPTSAAVLTRFLNAASPPAAVHEMGRPHWIPNLTDSQLLRATIICEWRALEGNRP